MHCLKMLKRLFGVEANKVGGDTGYAETCGQCGVHEGNAMKNGQKIQPK